MQEERIKILYVDDEAKNLTAFKASFRRSYKIVTAISAGEAAELLRQESFHIIIADQRMPSITGVEFFQSIRKTYPNAIRILLTGYTDVREIVDAINKGEIFRFITKPWNEFEMHNAIRNAYEVFSMRMQLQQKMEELETANHELNRLIYSTSHDLRSPLASIVSIVNLAKLDSMDDEVVNYFNLIENCAEKMDGYILKIVEYYKSVRLDDEYTFIDFAQQVQEAIDLCSMQNMKIIFRQNILQPVAFKTDAFRLSVVLNNLLSNAVKYQKPGEPHPSISIKVSVTKEAANISVEDNGIGIQKDSLDNIFQMFFRSTKNATGLGIGLYIVKEAVNRMGGDITIKSEFGVGTGFYVEIPNRYIE